ncbi:DUF1835 domain-containing protein [Ferruginibacter lapsinanis]|uniref:DUF1835 domain-containing protein n=1 Tax=Ferruginibacter lapsinanis TaxID=563172 RepID=UPI001E56C9BE|nr:DUF1835 domain-containing protein [Ferruginibacter lapsinanis]UEG49565.1 DUF1835 domain-containing protein [Ferruginibacter lapsinanis]
MIHVVFNEADVNVLKEAIALDESLQGEVVQIKDDYAVGPLNNIYVGEGIAERRQWWNDVLAGGDYERKADSDEIDDYKTAAELVGTLRRDENEIIWIWAAQNKHDVCGYYWLLNYMKEFQGRVFILYLNNLPFINEKGGVFYPNWLHEIPAKEFLKAKKLAREITLSEFEVDPDEWTKICNENKGVRLLEGGKKLTQEDYDFYDAELKKFITVDWQKASKIIHQYLAKAKHTTGDAYLLWRLKTMIAMGMFDVQGKIENMKDFEIKTKAI